jgi:hypothetical protein
LIPLIPYSISILHPITTYIIFRISDKVSYVR